MFGKNSRFAAATGCVEVHILIFNLLLLSFNLAPMVRNL